ncbi:transglycosylase domain-containing protein [Streptomyces sp. NPDC057411]|uniref:transglycosylase domain-containing protein n=2 Tax=Streptomyces TaxID=1883 RepID=UPI0036349C06
MRAGCGVMSPSSDRSSAGWRPDEPSGRSSDAASKAPRESSWEASWEASREASSKSSREASREASWEPRDPTVPVPPPSRARRPRRLLRRLLGLVVLGGLLLLGGFVAGYLLVDIPPANATAVAQSNLFLYRDGSQLARDGEVDRENVSLARIPLGVQHAVLAAEDRDFHTSPAVDPRAMVRATWNTLTGKGRQSGSTITQQYVKNYYLGQEQTLTRKAKEFFIAIKLGREKSKGEILEGYLNTSYFGRNAYGIQAAARAYYGKDAKDLDTAEGAYLASLLNAPNAYDVAAHPENRPRALARWRYVLDGMVKEGWLSPAARAAAVFPTPQQARPSAGLSGQRGYLVQAVEQYLTEHGIVDEKTLAAGGFRITTTLERAKQDAFVQAVDEHVNAKLDPAHNPADRYVRVGGAAIDPASGRVVALYGGIDYTRQFVNNATRRDYQVGSTFKPFVLAAALQHGALTQEGERITPNTFYDGNNRRPVQGWSGASYDPANEDDSSYGEITVRSATDHSVNAVYAQMAVDVGPGRVREAAVALGLPRNTPDLTSSPSIALGPATASVLDLAQAYATLANHGTRGAYTLVERIARDGEELELPGAAGPAGRRQALGREAADTTTSVLRSVVQGGTGTAALAAGRPAAGKTGTAEDDKAAWFAGYTPELATVVAMMGQDPASGRQEPLYGALGLPRINGGGAPAAIWGQFTREALAGVPPKEFDLRLMEGAEELPLEPPVPDFPDAAQGYEGPGAADRRPPRGPGSSKPGQRPEARREGSGRAEPVEEPVREARRDPGREPGRESAGGPGGGPGGGPDREASEASNPAAPQTGAAAPQPGAPAGSPPGAAPGGAPGEELTAVPAPAPFPVPGQ